MTELAEGEGVVPSVEEQTVDASKIEKPKARIKKPIRPDDAEHKQKVEALQAVSKLPLPLCVIQHHQERRERFFPFITKYYNNFLQTIILNTVTKHKARSEEIKKILDDRRSGRSEGSLEQQALKNKLAEIRNAIQSLKVCLHFPYVRIAMSDLMATIVV